MEKRKDRVFYYDAIRVVACLSVIIIHFNASFSAWSGGVFTYPNAVFPNFIFNQSVYLGDFGVSLFFILSGASMFRTYGERKVSLGEFYRKRFLSLYPMFQLAWFAATAVGVLVYGGIGSGGAGALLATFSGMDGYLLSLEYHSLWDKMPMINSYAESVGLYEAIFTKDFSDKGFRSDVYIDTSDLEGYTRYPLMMMADELIINRKCPVIKVKSFFQDYSDILGDTVGNCTIDALDYIKKEYSHYNVDSIWEHILRIGNMADIKSIMHLNYILPQTQLLNPDRKSNTRVALVMHLYYPELTKDCLKYAKSMRKKGDLIITVTTKEMKELVEKQIVDLEVSSAARVFLIENRGRDVSALLVGCAKFIMQYDLICFVHDKKTMQTMPFASGRSFAYKCFENNLVSEEYVDNIIDTFEKNPRLGLLTPPPPNHGPLYMTLGSEWASNYDNTVKLAKKLNIRCNIHWSKEPITPLGTMFWFRTKAMKKLFNYGWRYDDFPKEPNGVDGTLLHAIERIYGYVVQDAGYYVAWIMTDRFAKIELTNLSYMLRKKNIACFQVSMQPVCSPGRKKIKLLFKKLVPRKMWEFLRKTYRTWGGKKWVG